MTFPFVLGLLAEEPLHPGSGQSTGVVDLPVAREGHTEWPFAPETGIKGALREWDEERQPWTQSGKPSWIEKVYGKSDMGAGEAMISSGRLLLLPVRHLHGTYAWITCPAILERFWRDWTRHFVSPPWQPYDPSAFEPLAPSKARTKLAQTGHHVVIEDLAFAAEGFDPAATPWKELIEKLKKLMGSSPAASRIESQLTVVSNDIFDDLVSHALPITPHNALDENKLSTNLWYEETLPPDTLLYVLVAPRMGAGMQYDDFSGSFLAPCYRRIGGNETVGQGWVHVTKVVP